MGLALAAAAARRGADVTLIAANVSLPEPPGVRRIDVETADRAGRERPGRSSPPAHVLLMAAAPADFRASEPATGKLKREDSARPPPRADRGHPRRPRRIAQPKAKRSSASPPSTGRRGSSEPARSWQRKSADLIVLNDVSDPEIGFESEQNAVTLIDAASETPHAPDNRRSSKDADRRQRSSTERSTRLRCRRVPSACLAAACPAGYTELKLFRPYRCREVGLAHFFFAPNQA